MIQIWSFLLIAFSTAVFEVNGGKAISCYICNTAYPQLGVVTEETCRNPSKRLDFKPVECTESVLQDLNKSWMNEEWILQNINANDKNSPNPNTFRSKREAHWPFGHEKKDGWELKCMKEVIHRNSKPWLNHKSENFSQVVRFCEYTQVKPIRDNCEKPCDAKQLSDGECYICCTKDGCNDAQGLLPNWNILSFSLLLTFSVILATRYARLI